MKKTKKQIFFCLIVFGGFLLCQKTLAADHYVSPDGTATWANSTNISTPCSLSTANSNAAAGDTIYLRGGTYTITGYENGIAPSNSGTSTSNMITYSAYSDETPIIYGKDYAASPSNPATEADLGGANTVCINLRGSWVNGDWGGRDYIKITGITCQKETSKIH